MCIDDIQGALMASELNFNRVELCSALEVGGLTPSIGTIAAVTEVCSAEVFVMIRPRTGSFLYSDEELVIMKRDIFSAQAAGAKGVVFGVLGKDNTPDIRANAELIELAFTLNLGVTFHRAFDCCKDQIKALEDLIHLGFHRVLTSGGQVTAIEGIERLEQLSKTAQNRIDLMAGSGISAENAEQIGNSGVKALHFTARKAIQNQNEINLGTDYVTDNEKAKKILDLFR